MMAGFGLVDGSSKPLLSASAQGCRRSAGGPLCVSLRQSGTGKVTVVELRFVEVLRSSSTFEGALPAIKCFSLSALLRQPAFPLCGVVSVVDRGFRLSLQHNLHLLVPVYWHVTGEFFPPPPSLISPRFMITYY